MEKLSKIKEPKSARIGIYSTGLQAYWSQFPGLKECLLEFDLDKIRRYIWINGLQKHQHITWPFR